MYAVSVGLECLTELLDREKDGKKKKLFAKIIDASRKDTNGNIVLHYCTESTDVSVVDTVLQADPSLIDWRNSDGYTPLTYAVLSGNVDVAEYLLSKGADINHVDNEKHTPLHWATVCANPAIVENLLRRGALVSTPDLYGCHALHYATQLDDPQESLAIIHLLLKYSSNVNCADYDDRTPLLWAASSGNQEAFMMLLESGADKLSVDRYQMNSLHYAASSGHANIMTKMLQMTATRSITDWTDRNACSPLFHAASMGHLDCARILLQNGSSVNQQDRKGRTSVHYAAAKGQLNMLKLLYQHGASLQLQNFRGDIPLHEAVQAANIDVVNWLLTVSKESLNVTNNQGRTSLHLAAAQGNNEICQLLLDNGADINALMLFNEEMATPLDLGVAREQTDTVMLLLRNIPPAKKADDISEDIRRETYKKLELVIETAHALHPDMSQTDSPHSQESSVDRGRRMDTGVQTNNRRRGHRSHHRSRSSSCGDRIHRERHSGMDDLYKHQKSWDMSEDHVQANKDASPREKGMFAEEKERVQMKLNGKTLSAEEWEGQAGKRIKAISLDSDLNTVSHKSTSPGSNYMQEKKIFQELAALKRVQLQYGTAQEATLVRQMTEEFGKRYAIDPTELDQFATFSAWEKFLYDKLKAIYEKESVRLQKNKQNLSKFDGHTKRLLKGREEKIDRLIKTYGVAPAPLNIAYR